MTLSLIVAVDERGGIGHKQQLLCRLPDDLKRFKQLTLGHTVIMGRKTFESLPKGALPQRKNVVITSQTDFACTGCFVCQSWNAALTAVTNDDKVFVIGGASIYRQALTQADLLYLTRINHIFEQADTFFPTFNLAEWEEVERCEHIPDEKHAFPYTFLTYRRRRS
jgi:dihydrofolate reductase